MLTDFTKLEAWKEAMALAKEVHQITQAFPQSEIYGVTSQMRRSSLSVAANIAEGFGRYTFADKMHKYVQARGELIELMTEIHHCSNVQYINSETREALLSRCTKVHKLLNGLISTMKRLSSDSPNP